MFIQSNNGALIPLSAIKALLPVKNGTQIIWMSGGTRTVVSGKTPTELVGEAVSKDAAVEYLFRDIERFKNKISSELDDTLTLIKHGNDELARVVALNTDCAKAQVKASCTLTDVANDMDTQATRVIKELLKTVEELNNAISEAVPLN